MAEPENGSSPLAEALARVGDRWTLPVMRHPACGTLLETRWYCPTCDHLVDHEPRDAEVSYL
jgi:hypothetical protein